jgi:hypothetical protein
MECEEFDHLWTGGLRSRSAVGDLREGGAGVPRRRNTPLSGSMKTWVALVLECTGFPPFARALQREIDMPVFQSWGTLLDYAYSIVAVHRDYLRTIHFGANAAPVVAA